jgi:hypothetical protein
VRGTDETALVKASTVVGVGEFLGEKLGEVSHRGVLAAPLPRGKAAVVIAARR